MLLLNFAYPIANDQLPQIGALLGRPVERVVNVPAQFNLAGPLVEQVAALVDRAVQFAGLTLQEPLLVNPPSSGFIAAILMAELYRRMGHFPPILCIHPVSDLAPPHFKIMAVAHCSNQAAQGAVDEMIEEHQWRDWVNTRNDAVAALY